jgi:NodT family efflux transporter outer membrane factor (OMF) lipoprotein
MRSRLLLTLLPALVAGCAVGPQYHHPATPVPQAWTSPTAGGGPASPPTQWWTAFGSQQLDTLIQRAQHDNLDLAAATDRIKEADAQARIAGAPLLPSVGFSSDVGPSRQMSLLGKERHHVTIGGFLQASYELDFWGKNKSALQAAEDSKSAAQYDWQVVNLSTSAAVATAYFQYLGLLDQLRVAQDNLKRATTTLGWMSDMQRSGTIPLLDVVQQQTVVDDLSAQPPVLEQQAQHVHTALAILVGVLPEDLQLRPESLSALAEPVVAAGLPSQLLGRRPDVQEAEANLMAANADIRVARAEFLPSFNLTASDGLESYALAHYTTPPLAVYSLLGSMTAPLFEGGKLRGQLHYAQARYQELLQNYRKAALSAFGDVEDALTSVKQTNDQYAAQQKTLRSAQRSFAMAQEAFHGGTTTILNVFAAEAAVAAADDNDSQAHIAHMQSLVSLYKALGGGWSKQAPQASASLDTAKAAGAAGTDGM